MRRLSFLPFLLATLAWAQPPEKPETSGTRLPAGITNVESGPTASPSPGIPGTSPSPVIFDSERMPSAVPANYTLDSGDRVQVDILTGYEQNFVQRLDHNGNLDIYPAGLIRLRGLTSEQARRQVEKAMRVYFKNPVVALRIVQLRTFFVTVSGSVPKPGRYLVDGLMGVCDVVQLAGGPGAQARWRSIEVSDPGSPPKRLVDYLSWQRLGNVAENPKLHPNEIIYLPARLQEVSLYGQVAYPGAYDLLPGETLAHLVQYAGGGFLQNADVRNIQVSRMLDSDQRERLQLDAGGPQFQEAALPGDNISVVDRSVTQDSIVVLGEMRGANPAETPKESQASNAAETARARVAPRFAYKIRQGERVSDVAKALGGPTVMANVSRSRLQRKNPEGQTETIDFNLETAMRAPGSEADPVLQNGDTMVIPPVPDSVYVIGEVANPGAMPYKPGVGMREYLALAGGPNKTGLTDEAKLIRIKDHPENPSVYDVNLEEFLEKKNKPNLVMEAGDILYIPREGMPILQQAASAASILAPVLFLLGR